MTTNLPATSEQNTAEIKSLGVDLDAELTILKEENIPEGDVTAVQKRVDVHSVQTILDATQSCVSQAAPAVDSILKTIRPDRIPVFDSLVSGIISEADNVTQAITKDSLLSRIGNKFSSAAVIAKRRIEKAIHANESMLVRIERIRAKIAEQVALEKTNIQVMGRVANERRDIMRRTVVTAVAFRRVLTAAEQELASLRERASVSNGSSLSAEIMQLETNIAILATSIDTLERYRLLMFNGILESISAASSSYRSVSIVTMQTDIAINTIKQNVAIFSNAQNTSAMLSTEKRLRNASDSMSRLTSDLLKQNAIASAKAITTPGVSLETIEYGANNLRESMTSTREILSARAEERKQDQQRIDALFDMARKTAAGV